MLRERNKRTGKMTLYTHWSWPLSSADVLLRPAARALAST